MYVVIAVLIFVVCVLLTLIVLVQSSKGGGLASNFSGSNQYMGVRKTADFLEKSTWSLAVSLLVLSLFSAVVIPKGGSIETDGNGLEQLIQDMPDAQPAADFTPPPSEESGD